MNFMMLREDYEKLIDYCTMQNRVCVPEALYNGSKEIYRQVKELFDKVHDFGVGVL